LGFNDEDAMAGYPGKHHRNVWHFPGHHREEARCRDGRDARLLGKYAPVDLVRRLYREKSEPALGGELMEISVMFSDITGFTTLSEQVDPNRLADMLGLYLDTLSRIIQRDTHGTIDNTSVMPS
jgi:adenylate cyclase